MIATSTEIKQLLQITVDTNDDLITALLSITENVICDYCNNHFIDRNFSNYIASNSFVFASSDNSISLNNISENLAVYDTIRVYGTLRNDIPYQITDLSTSKLTVTPTVNDEDNTESKSLKKIKYPVPLKFIQSQMIKFNLDNFTLGMKSEKIDDYSITLEDNIQGYPKSIMSMLNTYRKVI